ncbi:hypothetical protein K438DRAFT_2019127 [Mycena galopus ATCC 62051]|nr:hypothetical protein K438DRAFT_2019127 [Mycena galopus ATCC 62051]
MLSDTKSTDENACLVFSLLNPLDHDAYCVVGISEVLNRVLLESPKDVERDPRQGPVLRAAMKFVSTRRSVEELFLFHRLAMTCSCQALIGAHRATAGRRIPNVLEFVLFKISSTIAAYFMRIGPGKFLKVKENTPVDARPWPTCIADVIPAAGGEREVLKGMVQWGVTVPGGHSVFCLIGALARYWEPFALEVFRRPALFALATNHLQHALDSNVPGISSAERYSVFVTPVIACAQGFFLTLSEVDLQATICLIAPIYEQMYAIAVAIEPILMDSESPSTLDHSRRWFDLVRAMRTVISSDGHWVIPQTIQQETSPEHHFAMAFQKMAETRNRNQCLNVECTTKMVQRTSVCSRCGIVRYCSKECLTAAWNSSELGHKSLCKKIVRLRAAMLLNDDKAWVHTVTGGFDPADMCMWMVAEVADAEGIWQSIHCLTDARLKFLYRYGDEEEQEVAADQQGGRESHSLP